MTIQPITIRTRIIKIGNSYSVCIPESILKQLGAIEEVELEFFANQLIIRSIQPPRAGWDAQFEAMAEAGDDRLLDDFV